MVEEPTDTPPKRRRWLWYAGGAAVLIAGAAGAIIATNVGGSTGPRQPVAAAPADSRQPGVAALGMTDPSGAAACEVLALWLQGKQDDPANGKPFTQDVISGAVSVIVGKSTTPAIKATVGDPAFDKSPLALLNEHSATPNPNLRFTNIQKLDQACGAAGVTMPPFTTTPK